MTTRNTKTTTKTPAKTAAKGKSPRAVPMIRVEDVKTEPRAKAPKTTKAERQAKLKMPVEAVLEPQGPVLNDAQIAACLAEYPTVGDAKNAADAAGVKGFDVSRDKGDLTRAGQYRINPTVRIERAEVDAAREAAALAVKTKPVAAPVDVETKKAEQKAGAKTKRGEIAAIRKAAETERKAKNAEKKAAKAAKSPTPKRAPPKAKDGEHVSRTSVYKGLAENVMEQARTFAKRVEKGVKIDEIVAEFKLASASLVRQRLQLLDLKDNIQAMVENGEISAVTGWGIALAPKSVQPSLVAKIKSGELKGSTAVKEAGRAARDAARA
jgi:hypothetical protein